MWYVCARCFHIFWWQCLRSGTLLVAFVRTWLRQNLAWKLPCSVIRVKQQSLWEHTHGIGEKYPGWNSQIHAFNHGPFTTDPSSGDDSVSGRCQPHWRTGREGPASPFLFQEPFPHSCYIWAPIAASFLCPFGLVMLCVSLLLVFVCTWSCSGLNPSSVLRNTPGRA